MAEMMSRTRPMCLVDPESQYDPAAFRAEEFDVGDLAGIWTRLRTGGNVYLRPVEERPAPPGAGKLEAPWDLLSCVPDLTVAVDEVQRFIGQQYCPPGFRQIMQGGRKLDQSVILATQQPQHIPDAVSDQATAVYIFRLQAKAKKYVEREWALEAPALPRYEWIRYSDDDDDE